MARKMYTSSASLEIHGQAAVRKRQPMPPTTALYLAQLRPTALKAPPKARQYIAIQVEAQPEFPSPVKIIQSGSN
jgi:hypothetical protein